VDSLRKPNSEIRKERLESERMKNATDFELLKNKKERGDLHQEVVNQEMSPMPQVSQTQSVGIGAPGIDIAKSPLHQEVEAILEDGLEDLYFSLNEATQEKFKKKGEETATKIVQLIGVAKATFRRVFKLIFKWLCIIPGVNKYFLEQEAKIKADRIIEIEK